MKQLIFLELLRELKTKPNLMRKVKIFAAAGVVVVLVTSVFIVWAGVSAFSYVAGKVNEALQSPQASTQVESFKTGVKGLSGFHALNCWGKTQSLMAVEPWLARPALDNLKNLKVVCFQGKPSDCEGHECPQIKQLISTAEGRSV